MSAVALGKRWSDEHVQDLTLRGLQVAVVSGFVKDCRAVQRSCLGLCNACREGVPVERMLVGEGIPQTRLAVVLPNAVQAQEEAEISRTRVLQPRRVLRLEWTFTHRAVRVKAVDKSADSSGDDPRVGNVDLRDVQWPEGTKEVDLILFDKAVEGVTWPVGLERLSFYALRSGGQSYRVQDNGSFNRSLAGANFPSGLREIFLGAAFDQPIEDVVWPQGLERLSLPGCNQPIDNVRWPPSLKSLEFTPPWEIRLREDPNTRLDELGSYCDRFNCPFTTLPASLETLWLGDKFDHSLEGVNWPSGLVTLGLGFKFKGLKRGVSWPSNLRNLYLVREVNWVERSPSGCKVTIAQGDDPDDDPGYLYDFVPEIDEIDNFRAMYEDIYM
ncbi:unnamed protein product [Ectocarpus sp. 12 AP-2014]